MTAVPGASVNEDYWALSYSWGQSGELIHKGGEDYERRDDGKHKITEYRRIEGHIMKKDGYTSEVLTDTDFDQETAITRNVTFQGLVQQICKDFGVNYIWFDQICINQGDHDAKMQEIKRMHHIYKNAHCTIALIPELRWTMKNGILGRPNIECVSKSEWCQRIWTLEEAYLSKSILFLGHNVHTWSDIDLIWRSAYAHLTVTSRIIGAEWVACTVLWYARRRTSSKQHDRMFALANIFPELMDGITFSYKQPLYDLMIKFYRDLAAKDISMMLFGAPGIPDPEDKITANRQKEARILPSWTGVNGAHVVQFVLESEKVEAKPPYTITGNCMRLTSSFITARVEAANAVDILVDDVGNPDKYQIVFWSLADGVGMAECYRARGEETIFTLDGLPQCNFTMHYEMEHRHITTDNGSTDLTFAAIPEKSLPIYTSSIFHLGLRPTHFLPLITGADDETAINTLSKPTSCGGVLSLIEECSECIILLEPYFKERSLLHLYPVIKKEKDCYKVIGACALDDPREHFAKIIQAEKTFDIL